MSQMLCVSLEPVVVLLWYNLSEVGPRRMWCHWRYGPRRWEWNRGLLLFFVYHGPRGALLCLEHSPNHDVEPCLRSRVTEPRSHGLRLLGKNKPIETFCHSNEKPTNREHKKQSSTGIYKPGESSKCSCFYRHCQWPPPLSVQHENLFTYISCHVSFFFFFLLSEELLVAMDVGVEGQRCLQWYHVWDTELRVRSCGGLNEKWPLSAHVFKHLVPCRWCCLGKL